MICVCFPIRALFILSNEHAPQVAGGDGAVVEGEPKVMLGEL
jgi:hypothetical protein